MSASTRVNGSYGALLTTGFVVRPFAASLLARLPISMAPLGIVILVQDVLGSYAVAGAATGAFAAGTAVGTPLLGRVMDRVGQVFTISAASVTSGSALAALAVAAISDGGPVVLLILAAIAGLSFPPMSAAMRLAWRVLLPDELPRRAGFALDAVAVECIFVVGPLLLSLLLAVTAPVVPLLVTAACLAGGGFAYSRTRAAAARGPLADRRRGGESGSGRVLNRRSAAVLVPAVAMAVGFGCIDTSLAATAKITLGNQAQVGVLFMAIAGGSAVGGLWYGKRHFDGAGDRRRLAALLALFAAGLMPLPFLLQLPRPPLWALLPFLFLAGLSIAPAIIVMQNLMDRSAPVHRIGEAQAWLSTANTTGVAVGTAAAGVVIETLGVSWSFGSAQLAIGAAAVFAALCVRSAPPLVRSCEQSADPSTAVIPPPSPER